MKGFHFRKPKCEYNGSTFMSSPSVTTRRFENQLRMEIVKNNIDWDMVIDTIPAEQTMEEDEKRR